MSLSDKEWKHSREGKMPDLWENIKEQGFTKNEYLKMILADIDRQVAEGLIDKATGENLKQTYKDTVANTTNPNALPNWTAIRSDWVNAYGETIVPSKIIKAGGQYYTPEGMSVDPYSANYAISDYLNLNAGTMTESQRKSLELDKQTLQFQIQQAGISQSNYLAEQEATRLWREEQSELERARLAQQNKQDTMEEIRADLENQYELDRLKELSNLGGNPANWIKRWEVKNLPNPYMATPMNLQNWTQMMANASRGTYAKMGTNPHLQNVYRLQAEAALQGANQAAAERWAAGTALPPSVALKRYLSGAPSPTAGSVGAGNVITPNMSPPNAPTPSWLSQFVPNQITGQPITRASVGTPSPQTWYTTPWSVQQGLSGYAEWAGGEPLIDIIGRMESMVPSGGTNERWIPRRTRTFV